MRRRRPASHQALKQAAEAGTGMPVHPRHQERIQRSQEKRGQRRSGELAASTESP
eukprot:CAMPEP_0172594322 /NCGR_PEP_ID=MMETSP1068-20121228/13686_1 /TAXON_ID=35684 /ORGANISM="Pseudopedinella elastica, Strain CCMP716" /LENGTH=54 /DNA_ID=CAMNT_0013392283 /DNA_START=135 /DNA_END=296 /DNA_ORIENTATION=+